MGYGSKIFSVFSLPFQEGIAKYPILKSLSELIFLFQAEESQVS